MRKTFAFRIGAVFEGEGTETPRHKGDLHLSIGEETT
jgi:hypothetical protein